MRATVVGGGVAGTVSAIALRRLGAEVTIVEAHPDPGGEVGSFVSLAVNGLRGLAAIDCLDRVRERGMEIARLRLWTAKGRMIADVPRGRRAADPLRSVTLMRGHLVAELRAAAREAGATIVTGDRFVGTSPRPSGVAARFASGRVDECDLLVGADGLHSVTRGVLDPAAPAPRYSGVWVISGRSPGAQEPTAEGAFNLTVGAHGAFVHAAAAGSADVWWQAQVNSPTRPDLAGVPDATRLARLDALYAAEPVARRIIAATTRLHRPSVNHLLGPVATWHDAHTVIVGDAAHPVGAGQGASMAIEDGLALARALAGAGSVAGGLRDYDRARRPRVTKVLKASDDNREVKQAGAVRRRATEIGMSLVFARVYERATGWLYDVPAPSVPGGD